MPKKVFLFGALAAPVLAVMFLFGATAPSGEVAAADGISYVSDVCVFVDRVDGSREVVEGCGESPNSNFFSTEGQELVMQYIGYQPNLGAVDVIGLCQGSTSTGGVNCYIDSGLTNGSGTFAKVDTGNWSISKTFTATDDTNAVNSTVLYNGTTTGGVYFAGNNFTEVTLNTNDQITIRWNISIS